MIDKPKMAHPPDVSVLVPCYNEESAVDETVAKLHSALSSLGSFEIVAIEDGSEDATLSKLRTLAAQFPTVKVVAHDRNRGYGAALKTGMRHAASPLVAIIDADGTYPINDLPRLVGLMADYDMVIGARTGANVTYSALRKVPKFFLHKWVNWIVNARIPDINSGMRVFRKDMAQKFVRILPNGFSFTITITISALRNNYRVHFEPIDYFQRQGSSKIHPIKDTLRFVQIIGRTGMYFAPLRILSPLIVLLLLGSAASLGHDIFVLKDLTEKSLVLLTTTLNVGIFAVLADMIDKRSDI
ncbi:glycosyltransferase family 2 protein [Variovorax beijingensis]|uniref:glycosyltransferase family 2 protein n=1 Tax=Variovorax beijingensis TaxID=2496117 RepID=UPI003F69549F